MSQRYSQASQRSMSSQEPPRSQAQPISSKELTDLARRAVRYLLMNDINKVPIKHSDIVKNVTKNLSKNTTQVMQLATKMLREVCTMDTNCFLLVYVFKVSYVFYRFYFRLMALN